MAPIIVGGLLQGSVFAIVALGFALVYRVTGVINLSQGAFCIVGALSMYTLQQTLGWPAPLAALAAVGGTTLFGAALGAATFVPALSRLPNSSMLMLTAGLLTLIEGLVLVVWGSDPYDLPSFSGEAPVDIMGVRVPTQGFWIAGTALIVIVALWYLLSRTILGKELRACAENPLAARLMGIDVARMTLLSFALAAMIGAIGGIVVAPIGSLQFDSGQVLHHLRLHCRRYRRHGVLYRRRRRRTGAGRRRAIGGGLHFIAVQQRAGGDPSPRYPAVAAERLVHHSGAPS